MRNRGSLGSTLRELDASTPQAPLGSGCGPVLGSGACVREDRHHDRLGRREVGGGAVRTGVGTGPAKRAAYFQAADKLMAAAVPVFPLYQRPNALIYRSSIAGMVANPNQIPVWNIEDWKWRS